LPWSSNTRSRPLGTIHEARRVCLGRGATQQLRREGFQVIEISEAESGGLFPARLQNDIVYVTSQLAIMIETGISLSTALAGIVEQGQPTLRKILDDVRNPSRPARFSAAWPLSETVRQDYCRCQGREHRSLAGHAHRIAFTCARTRIAAESPPHGYPAVIWSGTGVTIFLLTYILPKFAPLVQSRHEASRSHARDDAGLPTCDALAVSVARAAILLVIGFNTSGAPRSDTHARLAQIHLPIPGHAPQVSSAAASAPWAPCWPTGVAIMMRSSWPAR